MNILKQLAHIAGRMAVLNMIVIATGLIEDAGMLRTLLYSTLINTGFVLAYFIARLIVAYRSKP